MTVEEQARALDSRLTADLEPLEQSARLAEWEAQTVGTSEAFAESERLEAAMMRRLANTEDYALAARFAGEAQHLEPLTHRLMVRWRDGMARYQFDAETIARIAAAQSALAQRYNAFRANLDGKPVADNAIDEILRTTTDSKAAERAWRASKEIANYRGDNANANSTAESPIAERIRDLVHLRNQAAKQIGYANYYQASLQLDELDQDWLFETLEELDRISRPIFEIYRARLDERLSARFGIDRADLMPWHYGDRFFQSPPETNPAEDPDQWFHDKDISTLTIQTMDELGYDIRPIVERSDLYPGDPATSRKCQHAFCTTIVAPSDVRVLCNIVPGWRWMATNLHEFGHAIYGSSLDPELPYILRTDPQTLTNEAIALLMERHLLSADWLHRIAAIPQEVANRLAQDGVRRLATKHLVFTRWVLVMCHFERALYENPDHPDLGSVWWDLVERFQGLRRPEPERKGHDWASKIHFTSSPAYYQNYLLGEVFGAQLEWAIERDCGPFVANARAGEFLRERVFRPGASFTWRGLLEHATGKPMTLEHFVAKLRPALDEEIT